MIDLDIGRRVQPSMIVDAPRLPGGRC